MCTLASNSWPNWVNVRKQNGFIYLKENSHLNVKDGKADMEKKEIETFVYETWQREVIFLFDYPTQGSGTDSGRRGLFFLGRADRCLECPLRGL